MLYVLSAAVNELPPKFSSLKHLLSHSFLSVRNHGAAWLGDSGSDCPRLQTAGQRGTVSGLKWGWRTGFQAHLLSCWQETDPYGFSQTEIRETDQDTHGRLARPKLGSGHFPKPLLQTVAASVGALTNEAPEPSVPYLFIKVMKVRALFAKGSPLPTSMLPNTNTWHVQSTR